MHLAGGRPVCRLRLGGRRGIRVVVRRYGASGTPANASGQLCLPAALLSMRLSSDVFHRCDRVKISSDPVADTPRPSAGKLSAVAGVSGAQKAGMLGAVQGQDALCLACLPGYGGRCVRKEIAVNALGSRRACMGNTWPHAVRGVASMPTSTLTTGVRGGASKGWTAAGCRRGSTFRGTTLWSASRPGSAG